MSTDCGTSKRLGLGWRCRAIVAVLTVGWCVLAARLIFLQWGAAEEFANRAGRQRTFAESIPARPGEILDRHGRVLASTAVANSLWVNPQRIVESPAQARKLAIAVGIDPVVFQKQLRDRQEKTFLWVRRRLTDAETQAVERLELPADVAGFRPEFQRKYPQGTIAAHLIGLRDIDGVGRGGVEETFDAVLRGTPGQRTLIRDAHGKVLAIHSESSVPPKPGKTVVLTIDAVLQIYVERELDALMKQWKPKAAGVIVVEPRSGEVLAMASRPGFDPNSPENVPDAAWKNINIASSFEPGSTFKPMVVASALSRGLIKRDDRFDCGWGKYRMGPRLLHDHHPYGSLSVKEILVKSSNIGMAKIGEKLTNAGLHETAALFGFGRRTGCGLPGEIPGNLRPLKKWNIYSTGSIPMGQEIAVTPMQLIMAHAALANGGKLISPQIVRRIGDDESANDSESLATYPGRRVVSRTVPADVAGWIVREAMTDVVKRGTGKRAKLDDYQVFGKTGTAQKIDPATGRYSATRHVSSFIGGAPANDPKVLVLVVVDEPSVGGTHYGGTIAAPSAARIIEQSLMHLRVPAEARTAKRNR